MCHYICYLAECLCKADKIKEKKNVKFVGIKKNTIKTNSTSEPKKTFYNIIN